MNVYEWLKLPDSVVGAILVVALILLLGPYFGGKNFLGQLEIPKFSPRAGKILRWVGWLPFAVAVLAFIPWIHDPVPPPATFDVTLKFSGASGPLDCRALAQGTASLRFSDTNVFRATVDSACTAQIRDVPNALANTEASVDLAAPPPGLLVPRTRQIVIPGVDVTVALADAATVPRLRVSMLPPIVTDQTMEQQFLQTLLDESNAIAQTYGTQGPDFEYVKSLEVAEEGPAKATTLEMESFWNNNHSLQLVHGEQDQLRPTIIRSALYLGDLAPSKDTAMMQIDVPIRAASFIKNQDSFSMLLLYVLARDAERVKRPPHVVAHFLADAFAISQQLESLDDQMRQVADDVKRKLTALQTGSRQ